MNANTLWRGLLWKEARQVTPLILMLLAVSAVLFVIMAITSRELNVTLQAAGDIVPLIMPALYAAGAGAILVSHEKETRTMSWLASLPIRPQPILMTKFTVALAGLLLMWVGCVLLTGLAGMTPRPASGSSLQLSAIHPAFWFIHSIYVLLCGFYTAWKNKNAFPALVWIIPLALLPFFVGEIYMNVLRPDSASYANVEQKTWALSIVTLLFVPAIAWLAYRAGARDLQASEPEKLAHRDSLASVDAWRPPESGLAPEQPFSKSTVSLFWQSIHSSPWMSIGLIVPLVVGSIAWWAMSNLLIRDGGWMSLTVTLVGIALLATSWLGVSVFSGDGSSSRLKFLADRGVSPARVWVGRQWFGISCLSAIALFVLAMQTWLSFNNGRTDWYDSPPAPEASLLTIVLVLGIVYGVSQWVSQIVPMLAASAFLAPVLSGIVFGWLAYAGIGYGVPLSWLVVCGLIPFAATWVLMRWHMDGNRGWRYWAITTTTIIALMFFPIIPARIDRANFPAMSPQRVAELKPIARQLRQSMSPAFGEAMRYGDLDLQDEYIPLIDGAMDAELAIKRLKKRDSLSADKLISIGDSDNVPLIHDQGVIGGAIDAASHAKLTYQSNPDDEAAMKRLGDWIRKLTVIAKRLRLSHRWYDQEAADYTEIWLTQTISEPAMQPLRDKPFVQDAVKLLADFDGRQDARRRALLISWDWTRSTSGSSSIDSYVNGVGPFDSWFSYVPIAYRPSVMQPGMDAMVDRALRLIDAGRAGKPVEDELRALHDLIVDRSIAFEAGPYGDRNRVGVGPDNPMAMVMFYFPATQWFAPWEDAARQLGETSSDPPPANASPSINELAPSGASS